MYVVVVWGVEFARFGKKFGMRRARVLEWWCGESERVFVCLLGNAVFAS
jgi:hypothetical protein